MACQDCNFRKASCKHTKAICTEYDGTVNEDSTIKEVECKSLEETTQDIYSQLGTIMEGIDLSSFDSECLSVSDNKLLTILTELDKAICEIKESNSTTSSASTAIDITGMGLDFKCLVPPCGNDITTLKDLLQAIINKICTL